MAPSFLQTWLDPLRCAPAGFGIKDISGLKIKMIAERNVTRGLAYVLRVEWWLPEAGEEGEEGQGQDEQWEPSVPCAIQTILFTNLEEILNVCKMRGGYVL